MNKDEAEQVVRELENLANAVFWDLTVKRVDDSPHFFVRAVNLITSTVKQIWIDDKPAEVLYRRQHMNSVEEAVLHLAYRVRALEKTEADGG